MKIAALVVVKDEADVLPFWLEYMQDRVDYFLFRDNESIDGSYEIAKAHPKTVYCEIVEGRFVTAFWDKLIEKAQDYLSDTDWFLITAPDLFPFFELKLTAKKVDKLMHSFNCIECYYPNFFFTREMYQRYVSDELYKSQIDTFNIANYKYFKNTGNKFPLFIKNMKIEGQRVRYTRQKQEPPYIPNKLVYRDGIRCFGHYRFRSPEQMKNRLEQRKIINPNHNKGKSFKHYTTWNWEDYLISEKYLHNGEFTISTLLRTPMDKLLKQSGNI